MTLSRAMPEDIGLATDGAFRNASVDFPSSEAAVADTLSEDRIYIVPGFYGISADGRINLLGRGGSDYSAAAIARCIEAEALDVWKDVNGYMSADPGLIPSARRIAALSYDEAAELSYFGAKILHPRTVEPLIEKNIPVRIFNINAARTDRPADGRRRQRRRGKSCVRGAQERHLQRQLRHHEARGRRRGAQGGDSRRSDLAPEREQD